jgi:glyoxylase-like metal-dependent hydrolase (beta-lactamase superfamily II)
MMIHFPYAEPPSPGQLLELAPGVFWLRMPLPLALDHINLYVLDGGDGWWVVDTGMGGSATQTIWQQVLEGPLADKPLQAVIATHMHPDHIGQAGWLCQRAKVPLYMSAGEYMASRVFATMSADQLGWEARDYYISTGLGEAFFEKMKAGFTGFEKIVEPLPGSFRRLEEGQVLSIGERNWQVVIGRGHSPEHVCLWDKDNHLLLSGDQLIADISSNVSVMAIEPEADPLKLWLASLDRLASFPEQTLVMPAHKLPFQGVVARATALSEHHHQQLDAIVAACTEPQTAVSLLPVLFQRELDERVMTMAVGECVAHLRYLCGNGRLIRHRDASGVDYYQVANKAA